MLSVASSSHACRERVGRDHDHRRSRVRGDRRGVRGDPREGGSFEPLTTDSADTVPAQGKPRCITSIL